MTVSAAAATWYVSPAGSNANAGTDPASAFQTLRHAVQQMAGGDTIKIAPGNYGEGPIYDIPSGAPGTPTIIEGTGATPGEVVFEGGGSRNFCLVPNATSHYVVRNLRFQNYTSAAIHVNEKDASNQRVFFPRKTGVVFEDLELHNMKRGFELYSIENLRVARVHTTDTEVAGFYLINGDRVWVRDSSFRGSTDPNDGDGLILQSVSKAIVENCVASDNVEDGFDVGLHAPLLDLPSEDITFRNCVAYNNGGGFTASGDANASNSRRVDFVRCTATQNRRSDRGGIIAYQDAADIRVIHCTLHDNHFGFRSGFGNPVWATPASPVVLLNNIFSTHVSDHIQWTSYSNVQARVAGNLFTVAAPANAGTTIVVVPDATGLFQPWAVDEPLLNAAGSPAIDAGVPLTTALTSGLSNTTLVVGDTGSFTDGYGIDAALGDFIRVGDSVAQIVSVMNAATLVLDRPLTWSAGDPVSLVWVDAAPDLGVNEYLSPPVLAHVFPTPSHTLSGHLTWPSDPGAVYTLESTLKMSNAVWTVLGEVPGTGSPIQFVDPAASAEVHSIYRLRSRVRP